MAESTVEELAARVAALEEQVAILLTRPPVRTPPKAGGARYEQLLGAGKGLWETDEEFEAFVKQLAESRKKG